ncbi:TPA: YhbY family RNA-binding protein [archaeon]|uniref:Putative RNA-binding protein n=1 Tax=uncultured marine group II/III euryarchaeote KM3_51_D01 TaxID=1456454 RepID=A0A075H4K7_9EURY|nr:putative RNA-binding protein [uncultured marine group II/III euryarchaeote KM3_51_D01]HIK02170.1 YhbY family RNA-binding protein [Candidatus Undinarchaeales archaeon SRR5007147.bin71]
MSSEFPPGIKKRANQLPPSIRVGKSGLTEQAITEIKARLEKDELIKVKFLNTAINDNKKELFKELAERTDSVLVLTVGFTASLYKKKSSK